MSTSGPRQFPETRRTLVAGLAAADESVRARAVELLIETYWKPVYQHLRLRCSRSPADAQDSTQSFFASVIERGWLADFDASRSKFRTFLRVLVDRFAANEDRAARAEKRGGGRAPLPLDFEGAERELPAAAAIDDPDRRFEVEWRRQLFAGAIDALERDCRARGRPERFAAFSRIDLADGDARPSYADVARDLGVDVVRVTNDLAAARRELKRLVIERLERLTESRAEFDDELRRLLGARGPGGDA